MAETEAQMMVELSKHLGEFRVNSARRFEEQKLHSQYMENQLLEMKEILISMAARYRVQAEDTTVVKEFSHGCTPVPISAKEPSHQVAHHVLDEMSEPKEVSDSTAHQVLDKMPSDSNHDLAAHHVLDETPKSVNTIEIDDTESMEQEESIRDEPIVIDELLHQVALQVLDEMPEFTDEIDLEIARVSSTEERYDLEVFGVSNLNYAKPLLLFKNEFADLLSLLNEMPAQEEIRMNYREVFCFDPGGEFLDLVDSKLCLFTADLDLRMLDQLQSHFGYSVGKLIFYPGSYVDEVLVVLQAFDYELSDVAAEFLVEVLIGSLFEVLIFDPGGHLLIHVAFGFSAVLLMWSRRLSQTLMRCMYKPTFISDPGGQLDLTRCWHNTLVLLAFAVYFCLILGDKDRLKEGVLLQDFAVEPVCPGLGYYMY